MNRRKFGTEAGNKRSTTAKAAIMGLPLFITMLVFVPPASADVTDCIPPVTGPSASSGGELECLVEEGTNAAECGPKTIAPPPTFWEYDLAGTRDPPIPDTFYQVVWTATIFRDKSGDGCINVAYRCDIVVGDGSRFDVNWVSGSTPTMTGNYKGLETVGRGSCGTQSASINGDVLLLIPLTGQTVSGS